MQLNDPIQLTSEFVLRAKDRFRKEHAHIQQMQRDKRAKHEAEDELNDFVDLLQIIMATDESIAQFRSKLNEFRNSTVQNILNLQNQIDQLNAEKTVLLDNAHVLPDGRHVFRTKDGENVFDEDGHKISRDLIAPSKINSQSTSWDQFSAKVHEIEKADNKLNDEITTLKKIDELQVELDEGKPTADKLKELDERLEGLMAESTKPENSFPDPSLESPTVKNDSNIDPTRNSGMFN